MLQHSSRAAIALTAVALAFLGSGCSARPAAVSSPAPAPGASSGPTPVPVHVETKSNGSRYVTMVQTVSVPGGGARVAYEVRALSSQGDFAGSSNAVATFDQPHITFHDRTGKTLIADAPKATVTQRDKSVLMSGGVHAQTQDGGTLACDRLRYDGKTERIHGEGHVVMRGPNGFTIVGDKLDGNVRLDNVRVSRDAP